MRNKKRLALVGLAAIVGQAIALPQAQAQFESSVAAESTSTPAQFVTYDLHTGLVLPGVENTSELPHAEPGSSLSLLMAESIDGVPTPAARYMASNPTEGSPLPAAQLTVGSSEGVLEWQTPPGTTVSEVRWNDGALDVEPGVSEVRVPLTLSDSDQLEIIGSGIDEQGDPTGVLVAFDLAASLPPDPTALLSDDGASIQSIKKITRTVVKYEAYIPQKYIDAPDTGTGLDCESGDGSDYRYSGDDRPSSGGNWETGKYRTMLRFNYAWGTQSLGKGFTISPTNRYKYRNGTYTYDSTRTADGSGVQVTPHYQDGSRFEGEFVHSVGNPYCSSANSIDYAMYGAFYRTGGFSVMGGHDRMPNHTLYVKYFYDDGTYAYRDIFHHRLMAPECLNPWYSAAFCGGMQRYQISG